MPRPAPEVIDAPDHGALVGHFESFDFVLQIVDNRSACR